MGSKATEGLISRAPVRNLRDIVTEADIAESQGLLHVILVVRRRPQTGTRVSILPGLMGSPVGGVREKRVVSVPIADVRAWAKREGQQS